MTAHMERRRFDRFALQPMYNEVTVRCIRDGRLRCLSGHAYDISEAGLRIELDERLDVGEQVNVSLVLPPYIGAEDHLTVNMACQVIRINDVEDDPACPRMALRIVRYFDDVSRRALLRLLGSGVIHRVA